MEEDQPLKPANILNIVAINQGTRELTRGTPQAKPLSPADVQALAAGDHYLVDARESAAYGSGHVPGAINVQLSSSEFEQRVGWVVPDDAPVILMADSDADAQRCLYRMAFIGLDQSVVGYLRGGINAWMAAGLPLVTNPQMDIFTLRDRLAQNDIRVLDVREQDEWDEGHIEGSVLMPYTQLAWQLGVPPRFDELGLAKDEDIAVTCASAKRSSTAVSLLLREGWTSLWNLTGGMEAWESAGLPRVDKQGQACGV